MAKKPLALIIMDGWGDNPVTEFNAVANAKTPVLDGLCAKYAHTDIHASGIDVGLPDGQMGNSEVGHTNIGAGRVVYQELTRITKAIKDGDFFKNEVLCAAVDKAVKAGKAVHVMGLCSPGGVHSHQDHILAMLELAAQRGAKKLYFHAFLDGRDVPPRSALEYFKPFEEKFAQLGAGRFASVIGRYYAMDRDNRWDRVQQAYDLLTQGKSEFAPFPSAAAAAKRLTEYQVEGLKQIVFRKFSFSFLHQVFKDVVSKVVVFHFRFFYGIFVLNLLCFHIVFV